MPEITVNLPDSLAALVEKRVAEAGFLDAGDYVRTLLRADLSCGADGPAPAAPPAPPAPAPMLPALTGEFSPLDGAKRGLAHIDQAQIRAAQDLLGEVMRSHGFEEPPP